MENTVLNFRTTKNAAKFLEFRDKIANCVAVYFKYDGSDAAKSLEKTKAPIYEEPDDPDKDTYYVKRHKWKFK